MLRTVLPSLYDQTQTGCVLVADEGLLEGLVFILDSQGIEAPPCIAGVF